MYAKTTILIGNWSQSTAKFHASTKTKGFRAMFRRAGFNLFLVNERNTSKTCPLCDEKNLEEFKTRPYPRPWRKSKL
ncbi:hypothetical protein HDV03_002760, partial [Kappamyces sp. JEL0829]